MENLDPSNVLPALPSNIVPKDVAYVVPTESVASLAPGVGAPLTLAEGLTTRVRLSADADAPVTLAGPALAEPVTVAPGSEAYLDVPTGDPTAVTALYAHPSGLGAPSVDLFVGTVIRVGAGIDLASGKPVAFSAIDGRPAYRVADGLTGGGYTVPFTFVYPEAGTASGPIALPRDGTIARVSLLAPNVGTASVRLETCAFDQYPAFTSISGTSPIALSTGQKVADSALSGWTKELTKGRFLRAFVENVAGLDRFDVVVEVS